MPTYKLTYFNGRGRAEMARLIMAYGDIEYQDVRIENAQWPAMKAILKQFHQDRPVGQLPMLEVDGEIICQSHAIYRFLARKTGLMGGSDMEEAHIDMLMECLVDYTHALPLIYAEKDEAKKKALREKYEEQLPAETAKFEKLLKSDYFVGNKMSLADIGVANILSAFPLMGINLNLDNFPKLKALHDRVFAEPKIAAWVKKRPETAM